MASIRKQKRLYGYAQAFKRKRFLKRGYLLLTNNETPTGRAAIAAKLNYCQFLRVNYINIIPVFAKNLYRIELTEIQLLQMK